jgi:carbon monoxide dehydrogenase subunit G
VRLANAFEVPAPPERAWELLMDVPRVIPCMPGTELTETVDDSSWKAKMTVKLGPMSFAFATDVKREEMDEAARRARLSANAREMRGRGGGRATIESTLVPLDGGTRVEIVTDLALSGALAQYGRGMVEDVSSRLVTSFADCLERELTTEPAGAELRPAEQPAAKPISAASLALGVLRSRIRSLIDRLRRKE